MLGIGIQRVPSLSAVTGGDVALTGAGSGDPRPAAGSGDPRPTVGSEDPRPTVGSGPAPAAGSEGPCPAVASEDPRPAAGSEDPRPAVAQRPAPSGGVRRPRSQWGQETRAQRWARRASTVGSGDRLPPSLDCTECSFESGIAWPVSARTVAFGSIGEATTPPLSPASEPATGSLVEDWSDCEAEPDAEVGSATAARGRHGHRLRLSGRFVVCGQRGTHRSRIRTLGKFRPGDFRTF